MKENAVPYYSMNRLESVLYKAQILTSVCEYISNLSDVYNLRMCDYRERYEHLISVTPDDDYNITDCAKHYAECESKFDTLQNLYTMLQNYDF